MLLASAVNQNHPPSNCIRPNWLSSLWLVRVRARLTSHLRLGKLSLVDQSHLRLVCPPRSSENRSLVARSCLLTSPVAGWEKGGVCVITSFCIFCSWHKDILCYTMSRSSLAPAPQHDVTLSHLLLMLSWWWWRRWWWWRWRWVVIYD